MSIDSSAYSILVVDGDDNIQSLLKINLQTEGYKVVVCHSAEEALVDNNLQNYRLIITEVDLPGDIDGWELVEQLKDSRLTTAIPVMFCTIHDNENDIIKGLNLGADDYIAKPFSLREMMARIRSVLRRHRNMAPQATSHTIEYRTLIVNVDSHSLLIDGEAVSLTPTEFAILISLLRSRNKLLSREDIFKAAWPGEEMNNPRMVDVNISRLRKKLQEYGTNIVNRSGLGYGFMDKE
ncbi:MAG: response regulator transcription factor [Duncaniella sp.]|nr:response regulator transcription factor [Muribaculum sp.]MCM1255071.1 response regulator transcription factor [Duncaniella sp.]